MASSELGPCLRYEEAEARLLLAHGDEQHEIQIRAQGHQLVRYMVERNEAAGGAPALCTYDELMTAVWADEPMHSREELARLVWELRKKLEPFGAEHLIENERRRGYRMRTCLRAPATREATASDSSVLEGRPLRLIAALVLLAILAAAATAVLLTRGSSGKGADAELRPFVDRIENVLEQSAQGRQEIASALTAGFNCTIPARDAGRRIQSVADNRQSVLQQLGSLATPTEQAGEVITLLQRALQQSIEADRHYRDGFFSVERGTACPLPRNRSFRLAARSDARATEAKQRLVAEFDPLAERLQRRTWTADEF